MTPHRYPSTTSYAIVSRFAESKEESSRATLRDIHRVAAFRREVIDGGGALEFVPGEGTALNGALQGLDQDYGKELPVREALKPDLAKKPAVLARLGVTAFESEGNRRCQQVNDEKNCEIQNQFYEVGGIGGIGMEVLLDGIPKRAAHKHYIDEG